MGVGVDEGAGVWLGVGGAGVGVAFKLFTTTEINAVPIGVVPPCWKARTISLCVPFATVVVSQVRLPLPDSTLLPSTWS